MQVKENQRLKMLRRHLDKTQEEFAEPLGISEQVYRNIESGRTKTIGTDLLGRVVEAYNCDWEWLVAGTGQMMRNVEQENAEEGVIKTLAVSKDDELYVTWEEHAKVLKEVQILKMRLSGKSKTSKTKAEFFLMPMPVSQLKYANR